MKTTNRSDNYPVSNPDNTDEEDEFDEEDWDEEEEEGEEEEDYDEDDEEGDEDSHEAVSAGESAASHSHDGDASRGSGDEEDEEWEEEEVEEEEDGNDDNEDVSASGVNVKNASFTSSSEAAVAAFAPSPLTEGDGADDNPAGPAAPFPQFGAWANAPATSSSNDTPTLNAFAKPTPSAFPAFAGSGAVSASGVVTTTAASPLASGISASSTTVEGTPAPVPASPRGNSAAAASLQFADFKRTFGQGVRRPRSAAEEERDVKASLARYELVLPTDKFDEQIERALYSR